VEWGGGGGGGKKAQFSSLKKRKGRRFPPGPQRGERGFSFLGGGGVLFVIKEGGEETTPTGKGPADLCP